MYNHLYDCCRRSLHEASLGNCGRAGLVPGPVGDHTNSPLRLRYGFAQGKLTPIAYSTGTDTLTEVPSRII